MYFKRKVLSAKFYFRVQRDGVNWVRWLTVRMENMSIRRNMFILPLNSIGYKIITFGCGRKI